MSCGRVALRVVFALLLLVRVTRADDSLPPDTARRVKEATVYVKVSIGPVELSGSGFVVHSSGDSALVVTNEHVVAKPGVLAPGGYIPGLRGRDRFALRKMQAALNASEPAVTVVFNSGEPNEQSLKADVLCKLEDPDLAVLKVSSFRGSVTPIEFRQTPQPVETMSVFILGFPFGESLSTNKGNPNITVGRGAVSSIRKDSAGKVVKVQVDGGLNPGNSGGPVVDGQGRLVGVAVQKIQNTNMGLAIPASALADVFQGTVGAPAVTAKPGTQGAAARFEIVLPVVDPFKRLRAAAVQFVTKVVSADPAKAGQPQLASDASSRRMDLTLSDSAARAELPAGITGGQQLTVQASVVNEQGATVYFAPQIVTVPAPPAASAAPGGSTTITTIFGGDGSSTTTVTRSESSNNGSSRRQVTMSRSSSSGKSPANPGANKKSAFKPGDKVLVDWAGKMQKAEVTGVNKNGWVEVKFKQNGIEMTPTLPPDGIKLASKTSSGEKKAGSETTPRTWSSQNGKFRLKAKFVRLKDDQLTLEKENGETITVALAKLSDADQKAARELAESAEENPFESGGDNPFESGAGEADDDAGEPPAGDWSQVAQVTLEAPEKFSLAPDAAPAPARSLTAKPVVLMSPASRKGGEEAFGFFEKVDGLLFNSATSEAIVATVDNNPGKVKLIRVQRVDLVKGKAAAPLEVPNYVKPVDLDLSGKRLLARSDFFVSGNATPEVSVWELGEKSVELVKRWNPHDPDNVHKQAPTFARFIDSDHVVTAEFPGRLAVWQVSGAKVVYSLELTNGGVPGLSATGRYLAAPVNNGLYVFEAQSGKVVGNLPGDPGTVTALSFSPDGRQLASLSHQRLVVWDLQSGDLYRDIYFPTPVNGNKVDWVGNGFVLLGGEKLIDLERRIVLWQYQLDHGGGQGYGEMGGYFWYVISDHHRQERGLFRAKLPHEEPVKIAATLDADQLLAIKPGIQVSLNVAVQGDQQAVEQSLSRQLQALGMTVVPGSPIVLQASTEAGQTKQMQYRTFGAGRSVQTAQVTEQIARVKFIENSKVVWEAVTTTGAPFFLRMKAGESLQSALAPHQKPNIEFFSHVKLPQYVARPAENGAYGASQLTFKGIQTSQVVVPKPGG
jgi:WD40 repeat protein